MYSKPYKSIFFINYKMKIRFKKQDIGKRVKLELNSLEDRIASSLGASNVFVYGKILDIYSRGIKVECITPATHISSKAKIEEIPYTRIINYNW